MKKYLPDWFISGLFLMIFTAWLKPGIGMDLQPIHLGLIIDIGVVLIFFFYGLKLDPARLKAGMSNWRMHAAVQLTTFLVFPLLVLPFYPLIKGTNLEVFWMGMFFLAALPSTVSSSVVMVSIAGGNIPGAIFNASISGIIGIVATPFWVGLFLTGQQAGFDFSHVLIQLFTQIIVPVVAGLMLHKYFVYWINRHLPKLATFDKTIILLIVYESFSRSFLSGIFTSVSWVALSVLLLAVILLFFFVLKFTGWLAHKMKFSREDRITLQFAGTKKSLVHGSVFSSVLFSGISGAGIFLLPIMIYHSFQLFYISVMARKMSKEI
ncbi:solute carrier family 10 (sodium/bile acid cotransporter), member 7 [Mariniphaga anaerophila]|uniref:Solute carrier family 10 (Sodium/bile acid cotransporter), member 7 n=1 Tax=Mariniphaga anaerophila TaxID=1484053 RepID=A0A1M4YM87_9BACT|nr:bile acid:sodium symporter family protein [Mariniphaga anaerophila]SHF06935.1 solute carrier family 10 (sodium/bile acid cotransporter), member 7 [Mariniphaga anaerophila]